MSGTAIKVERLGKRYRIGSSKAPYKTIRESLTNAVICLFQRSNSQSDVIWALKDVSFEVKHGEVVGIIGRNGAGKTTLLKILSRITEPTEGYAEVHGRVGSLLEVGTGFHPELTGRENVYLNGAILGMKKREIVHKFDEIVAFAEVEKFIDTPMKRYSSGMQVRLAFAIAAHLEPEILLVDEVLAVGDAAFQKKCLGKMSDVAKEGRTVLFVSHNMAAVNRLCRWAIWLNEGQIHMTDVTENVVGVYLSSESVTECERQWNNLDQSPGNENIRLRAVRVLNSLGKVCSVVDSRHHFYVEIEYDVLQPVSNVRVGFFLVNSSGTIVFDPNDNEDANWRDKVRTPGRYISSCKIPGRLLNSGTYTINIGSDIPFVKVNFLEESVVRFSVENTVESESHRSDRSLGVICPPLEWRISEQHQ